MLTVQKKESKYVRSLLEASLDPLVTINIKGKIMDMNQATVNITGIPRQTLTGTDFFNYFTEPQKAREVYQEVFAKGSVSDSPLTLRHIGGKLTDVLFNGSVYKDDNDAVQGVVIVARDVTEQKRIATELIEAKNSAELAMKNAEVVKIKAENAAEIAENAMKSKQQFLSNMSHEIRTPLNSMIGFTKVMLKTELTIKQKEYLAAIKMSGNSLIVLINDILDLAKVDAGKMTFEKTAFKLSSSFSTILHVFENKMQEKNLTLIKSYDPNIPEVLLGDPARLHQIILNLVSNAVKFTSQGRVTVSVQLVNETKKSVRLEFSVSDTGIGIKEKDLSKIFDNFQQVSSETSRIFGGTGLGLAIVKQLVEAQGGSLSVKSVVDVGTTFGFMLDFQRTAKEATFETEFVELEDEIKDINVLVVEDVLLNQLLMKTLLDEFGFDQSIASNGLIAIEKLKERPYDIILMDLQMPEMNGFDATKHIRNVMKSEIPIIALTADVTTVDLDKCIAAGMNDYIAKPVDERLLYNKIVGLVAKQKLENTSASKNDNNQTQCINLTYLVQFTKSNPQIVMEMIALYLDQTPSLITLIKESFLCNDWETLQSAIHKIIPSFSMVGINSDFTEMAKKLQAYAEVREEKKEMYKLVMQLENICNQACAELEVEYELIKKGQNEN